MNRSALYGLTLLLLAGTAAAQEKPADISRQIIGTWEGAYQSQAVPPGNLKLVVAREAGVWKATLQIVTEQPPNAGELREFTIQGNTVSWIQDVDDMQCKSVSTLVAGVLKGEAECSQGGAVVLTATFLLEKKQ